MTDSLFHSSAFQGILCSFPYTKKTFNVILLNAETSAAQPEWREIEVIIQMKNKSVLSIQQ